MTEATSKAYEFERKNYLGYRGNLEALPEPGEYHFPLPDGPNFDTVIERAKQLVTGEFKNEPDYSTPFAEKVLAITDSVAELLVTKNAQYGDAALNPIRVFSKGSVEDMLNVRADDKLSRIARGDGTGDEDAEMDLIGYLILKRVARMEEK